MDLTAQIQHRLLRSEACNSRFIFASGPRSYRLSSCQDAECSLYSESCWHNFDPDVRANWERVGRTFLRGSQ
jgi:hypothetical protein